MIPLLYKGMCPNCGGDICSERLSRGTLCPNCLPDGQMDPCEPLHAGEYLKYCALKRTIEAFERFFTQRVGSPPRALQRSWAKRLLSRRSFALLAPTGIGKSTFGLSAAGFLHRQGERCYLLFPTRLLARQAAERLIRMGESPLLYDSQASPKEKASTKAKIQEGDFGILVTTISFLYRNFALLPRPVDFIFVDDVDSLVKSAKNIDKVLILLGFEEKDLQKAMAFIRYKRGLSGKRKIDWEAFEAKKAETEAIAAKRKGTLVVSSATANPRGSRVQLFRELLGFELSRPSISLRKVEDLYEVPRDLWEASLKRIESLGKGGLVFLPAESGKETLEAYRDFLRRHGIKASDYEAFDEEAFRTGAIDVVLGFASYRNPLARGIDLPEVVRYALFVGVPKFLFPLDLHTALGLYRFLRALLPAFKGDEAFQMLRASLDELRGWTYIPSEQLAPAAKERIEEIRRWVESLLTPEWVERINQDPEIPLFKEEGFHLITADVTGYIQASGRTSRLYAGGLTQGLALLLIDSLKAFRSLENRLRWFNETIRFKKVDAVDLDAILKRIDEDRRRVREAKEGRISSSEDPFKTTLVVVESPTKARTIAHFYGKPLLRETHGIKVYEIAKENRVLNITASKGHLFDLEKEEGFHGVLTPEAAVPIFEPLDAGKREIVTAVRELTTEVEELFIATDPDREGEKIAYDIFLNSRPYTEVLARIEFHEVTPRAFDEALQAPKEVEEARVRAQLLRRIADRWIGFEISRFLQERMGQKGLSAGRVQTAVLEWIVLREAEAREKVYVVEADFGALHADFLFEERERAKAFYESLRRVELRWVERREKELFRLPYSTDGMLYDAAALLHFSPQRTMQLAQELFERGLITYHRTDSIRVSPAGLAIAKTYILERFGEAFYRPRSPEAGEGAHEAIRPTRGMDREALEEFLEMEQISLSSSHLKLYDLIFRNFIASQMKAAKVLELRARVLAEGESTEVTFYREILEHGIDLIWPVELKAIKEGSYSVEKRLYSRSKVPRYSYAQVIRMMKERGVGRPSTYAVILEKLLERHYVLLRGGVLHASSKGIRVYEEIRAHPELYRFVNEAYTRELEALMDEVEAGARDYREVLKRLYTEIREVRRGGLGTLMPLISGEEVPRQSQGDYGAEEEVASQQFAGGGSQ